MVIGQYHLDPFFREWWSMGKDVRTTYESSVCTLGSEFATGVGDRAGERGSCEPLPNRWFDDLP